MHPATTTSSRPGAQAALDVQVTVPRGERKLRGCLQVKALRIHPRKTRVCPEQTVNLGAQSGWPAGRKADPTPRPQLPLPAPGLFHLASSTASSRHTGLARQTRKQLLAAQDVPAGPFHKGEQLVQISTAGKQTVTHFTELRHPSSFAPMVHSNHGLKTC